MKNLRFLVLFAFVATLLVCCNPQDEISSLENEIITQKAEQQKGGNLSLAEVDDKNIATFTQVDISDNDGDYCVYKITQMFGECANPDLKVGNIICVDCTSNKKCPGSTLLQTSFKYIGEDGQTCKGKWKQQDVNTNVMSDCGDCPDKGKKGYKFIN